MTASSHPTRAGIGGRSSSAPAVRSALLRYRAIAYTVGVGLIVLVCVGMPLKYAADKDAVVAVVGPIHGVLYMVYLAFTFELAARTRLPFVRTVLIMLAGTIPFLSFVAERRMSAWVRANHLAPAGRPGAAGGPPTPSTGSASAVEASAT